MKIYCAILFLSISFFGISQSLTEKVQEINELKAKGDYQSALSKTNKLISEGNEIAALYLIKAQCLMEGNRQLVYNEPLYEAATDALIRCIELDSTLNLAYGRRGLLNLTNRRFDEAILDFTKYISLSMDSLDLFYGYTNRGVARTYLKDYQGAIEDYEKAISINGNDASIYSNLSSIYINYEEPEKALEILSKGLEIFPKSPDLLNNMGFLNIKQGDYKVAKSYFDQAIAINSNDFLALGNRGFCFIQLDKMKNARADLDKSIRLKPDNSYVYKYNAQYYIKKNDINEACKNLKKAISLGYSQIYDEEVKELIKSYCR